MSGLLSSWGLVSVTWVYGIPRNSENRMDSVTSLTGHEIASEQGQWRRYNIVFECCWSDVGLMSVPSVWPVYDHMRCMAEGNRPQSHRQKDPQIASKPIYNPPFGVPGLQYRFVVGARVTRFMASWKADKPVGNWIDQVSLIHAWPYRSPGTQCCQNRTSSLRRWGTRSRLCTVLYVYHVRLYFVIYNPSFLVRLEHMKRLNSWYT